MRLIVEYTVMADCGADSFTVSEPVIADSKESFLKEFSKQLQMEQKFVQIGKSIFFSFNFLTYSKENKFNNKKEYLLPKIYTVDEWFSGVES